MAAQTRIAAVTGGNKGIGLAIVRNLALTYPSSPLRSGPFLIYLTARSAERGAAAVKALEDDPRLKKAKVLAADGGDTTIKFHELDIGDPKSIRGFRSYLEAEHPDGIDAVINNAGIALDGYDADVIRTTIQINYHGTLEATRELLPLVRQGGRLVNVCSAAGKLNKYSESVADRFRSAPELGVPAVTSIMELFEKVAAEGGESRAGFPSQAYGVSKAGAIAMTKAVAIGEGKKGGGVLINACCPGYVNTDMTKGRGTKTPDQGARTPVLLALEEIGGRTGEFWQGEAVSEW